ncbi:FAD-dependent oxidoreductase [Vannielia sp.]|uniref:FAD-dependent oxidoreductase n=1 Tax=Vannielia sp. TaxID=2813045 RepID=UPI002616414D|nr:FAD-dependent oxidoreductase [Vannielia sp.]MDF1872473.1 FAD-dependent oxidoreductase [Vannielia sp.]
MALIGTDILVVGGGIAGLATARALAMRGAAVTVLEQAPAIAEVGAGIQMSPNGYAVLDALGLTERFEQIAVPSRGVRMIDGIGGRDVLWMGLAERGRFAYVHRADFIEMLEQGARDVGVQIALGQRVERVEPGERPVVITGEGAREAALVIGADGLHSVARRALLGPEEPVFTHQVAWRATVDLADAEEVPGEAQLFLGAGRHLVAYPLRGGRLLNLVACEDADIWVDEGWQVPGDVEEFRIHFAGFPARVEDWLHRVDSVRRWGLFRHAVAPRWHREGVAILGDAAHPTLPYLAQGAVMGLEDGWTLAAALEGHDSPEAGLASWEAVRRPRSRRIVEAATANAQNYHLRPGPKRMAAHLALRTASRFAPRVLPGRFDWLWGEDVTAG